MRGYTLELSRLRSAAIRFEGKGVLVTGGSSEIGEAIAARLASEGADTVVSGRDTTRGEAVARRLTEMGPGRSTFIAADLIAPDGPAALAEAAEEWLKGVDVLVNNAATGVAGPSSEISNEDWDAIFGLNVRGPYLLSTFLMTRMAERGAGVVVNVTSAVAYRGWPGYAAYASSKAALDAMTKCWAATYGLWGVRVNAISPGPVLTPRALQDSTPEGIAEFCSIYGQGRYGTPDEVAGAVAFLASSEADYVHGTTLQVDGGMLETFGYQPISLRSVARGPSAEAKEDNRVAKRRILGRFF